MSDGNEGNGKTAAKEKNEERGQAVTVVNSEWQVLKKKKAIKYEIHIAETQIPNLSKYCNLVK